MDIFFCDDCGSRVTDGDLRSGKGVRRRHVVTCSNCVDSSAAARVAAVDPVRVAIDRAQTIETDDHPPAIAFDDSDSSGEKPELHDTAKVRTVQPNLADALGGFGALAPQAPSKPVDDAVEDVDDLLADDQPVDARDETSAVSRPRGQAKPADKIDKAEKAETAPVANDDASARARRQNVTAPAHEKAETDEHDVVEPPAASAARPARSTSNRQPKSGKSKGTSTRATRPVSGKRGKGMNQNLLMLSGLSALILLAVIIYAVQQNANRPKPPRQEITLDGLGDLRSAIGSANAMAEPILQKALAGTATKAELDQAINQINSILPKTEELERQAKSQGRTDEEIGRIMDGVGYKELMTKHRTLRDKRVILMQRN
jgi:hypothetical protein